MKRLFTFGCSFTNYHWPTWADIVSQDYDYYENWGRGGAGNKFIYFSLVECHQRNCITTDDTVIIMWSSQAREDKFLNNEWYTPGTVYSSAYTNDFISNFTDTTGYLLDTVTYIQSSNHLLDSIGCEKYFLSMLPMYISSDWFSTLTQKLNPDVSTKILKLYAPTLQQIKPSIYETVFKSDWHSKDKKVIPQDTQHGYDILYKNYTDNATTNWPTFNNFYNNEMQDVELWVLEELDKKFNLMDARDKVKLLKRADLHPTPIEHLEYLQCINFNLSTKAEEFAKHWEELVMRSDSVFWCLGPNHQSNTWSNKTPERF